MKRSFRLLATIGLFFLLVGLIPAAIPVSAQTEKHWIGGDGLWNDPDKWNPVGVPTSSDNVYITVDGDYTVILTGAVNVNSVTLGAAGNASTQTLWVQGNSTVGSSYLSVSSSITNAGTIRLESLDGGYQSDLYTSGGTLTSTGSINVNQGSGGPRNLTGNVDNQGTINVTSDSFHLDNGTFTNTPSGSLTIASGGVMYASGVTFNQAGTVTVDGTVNFDGTFNQNSGTIAVNPGASMITGTFNANSGVLNIADGGYFGVHSATLNYNGSTISGAPVIYNGNLNITVPGAVTFIVRGSSNLLSDIPEGYTVWVQGNDNYGHGYLYVSNDLTNAGTIRLEGTGSYGYQSNLYVSSGTLTNTGSINASQGSVGGLKYLTGNIDNQGSINVTSDSFLLQSGTFTNTPSGSLTIASGGVMYASGVTFQQGGTVTVDGTVNFDGTFNQQEGTTTVNGTASFTGTFNQDGGTIAVNPGASMTSGTFNANSGVLNIADGGYFGVHSATLSYNGSTISGAPVIYNGNLNITVPGAVTFIVRGGSTLLSDIPQGYTVWVQGNDNYGHGYLYVGNDLTNAGTIRLEGIASYYYYQSGLLITGGTLTNTGSINAGLGSGSQLVLTGNVNNQGSLNVTSPSFYLQSGTFTNTPSGSLTIASGGVMYASGVTFNQAGTVTVDGTVNFDGTFNQQEGTTTVNGTASFTGTFNQDGGTIAVNPGASMTSGTFNASSGVLNIADGGYFGVSSGTFSYNGSTISGAPVIYSGNLQITVPGAVTFIVRGASTLLSDIPQGYTVWVQGNDNYGHGYLYVGNDLTNAGTIRLEGIASYYYYQSGLLITGGTLTNTGSINAGLGSGSQLVLTGNVNNQGSLNVTSPSFYLESGTFKSLAPASINGGGTLYLSSDSIFFGSGDVSANINSSGQVNVGASPGILNINGDYTQNTDGTLNIEAGGPSPGSGFDQLSISGTASLAGTLNVTMIDGFLPSIGDEFQFLTFATQSGDFGAVTGVDVDLGNGVALSRVVSATDQTLVGYVAPVTQYTLTMAKSGSGSVSPAPGPHTYEVGTVVGVTALAAPGWQFVGWTGDVANPNAASTSVTMNADKQVTANFSEVTSYTLNTSVNGGGNVSPAAGTHTYSPGAVVSITATPNAGWQFSYWTGDVANTFSASTTVTLNANKTVIATFVQTGIPVGGEVAPVSAARVLATWLAPGLLLALAIGGGLVWRRRISRV